MIAPVQTATGAAVGLEQMLAAREQRAARQAAALARFCKPLVSATVVMPGAVKDGRLPRRVLSEALYELETLCGTRGWRILAGEVLWRKTGPEALYVIDAEGRALKFAILDLEEQHPIGRLWDLDVIAPALGLLSRQQLGFPARRCLLCEEPAHGCARSRRHSTEELLSTIGNIVHEYDRRSVT